MASAVALLREKRQVKGQLEANDVIIRTIQLVGRVSFDFSVSLSHFFLI